MPSHYSLSHAELMHWPVLMPGNDARQFDPVALDRPVCVVGARASVHLPLTSKYVSKAHALIVQDAGGVYIRDLASRNHTLVNSENAGETPLENGDSIRFGPFTFTCQSGFSKPSAAARIAPAELRLQPDGMASRQLIALRNSTFLIGCREGCDLLLEGEDISLAHAIIFARDGKRFLRDLSSISGTYLNDKTVRQAELKEGDLIRIGQTSIEFSLVPCAIDDEAVALQEPDDLQMMPEFEPVLELAEMQPDDGEAPLSPRDADLRMPMPWEQEEVAAKLDVEEVLAHQRQMTQRA